MEHLVSESCRGERVFFKGPSEDEVKWHLISAYAYMPSVCNSLQSCPPGSSVTGILLQEYWNGLPFPPLGYLAIPGIKPPFPVSPALAGEYFTTEPPG